MIVSRHIFKYMQKQNPKFGDVIKINNHNKISCVDLEKIYKDEELNKIWLNTINNLEKIIEEVIPKRKTKEDIKEYRRIYSKKYYNSNEMYREVKNNKDKQRKTKIKTLQEENDILQCKISHVSDKLKNVLKDINVLSVEVN